MNQYGFEIKDLAGRTIRSGIQVIVMNDGADRAVLVNSTPSPQTILPDRNGLFSFQCDSSQVKIRVQMSNYGEAMYRTISYSTIAVVFNPETELSQLPVAYGPTSDRVTWECPKTDIPRTSNSSVMIDPAASIDLRTLNPGDVIRLHGEVYIVSYDYAYANWTVKLLAGEDVVWSYHYPMNDDDHGYDWGVVTINPKMALDIDTVITSRTDDHLEMLSSGNFYTQMYDVYNHATGYKKQHPNLICQTNRVSLTQTQLQLQWSHTDFQTYSPVLFWRWGVYKLNLLKP
jgi:hypothetical protein